jgi:UDP-N-acetyl-D-mannosaminuronate dehydrogenase
MKADLSYKEQLLQKIASKSATVGVIGLGYVGLPLAPGQLVALESTTYPGTTREEFVPRLDAKDPKYRRGQRAEDRLRPDSLR